MAITPTSTSTVTEPQAAARDKTGTLSSTAGNKFMGDNLDSFLKLLTTQLKHQDPTSPIDSYQFTSQLVSFAGVEQQISVNKNLESLIGLQETNQKNTAVSFIGKQIESEGDNLRNNGAGDAFSYEISGKAKTLSITVMDSKNAIVNSYINNSPTGGRQPFSWDGKDANGNNVMPGAYKVLATAVDEKGNQIPVKTYTKGTVDGVDMANGQVNLLVGGAKISLNKLQSVTTKTN